MRQHTSSRLWRGVAVVGAVGLLLSIASVDASAKTKKTTKKKKAAVTTTKKAAVKTTKKPDAMGTVSKGTVKLGVLAASTSIVTGARNTEETRKLAQAWEKQVNSTGGINGYKVEMIYKDTQQDTARTLSAVKELDKEGVLAIAGQSAGGTLQAVMSTIEKAKIPIIGGSASFESADTSPMYFHANGNSKSNVFGLGKALWDAGAKNVRVLYCSDIPVCADSAPRIVDTLKSLGGTGSTSTASRTGVDFTANCLAAKKDGVDGIELLAIPLSAFIRDCQRQNYHPIYSQGTSLPYNQASMDLLSGERYFASSPSVPLVYKGPEFAAFRSLAAKTDLVFADLSQTALDNYMGFEMAGAILKKMTMANPTRADFLAATYTIKGETLGGLLPARGADYTGMKNYTEANPNDHESIDCWTEWGVFDNEWRMSDKNGSPSNAIQWQCGSIFYTH